MSSGWVQVISRTTEDCVQKIIKARSEGGAGISIGYHGNIVDLWEALAAASEEKKTLLVDLGSDQTSLHNPWNGGYYPVQISFEEARSMMVDDPDKFKELVQESLKKGISSAAGHRCCGDEVLGLWEQLFSGRPRRRGIHR